MVWMRSEYLRIWRNFTFPFLIIMMINCSFLFQKIWGRLHFRIYQHLSFSFHGKLDFFYSRLLVFSRGTSFMGIDRLKTRLTRIDIWNWDHLSLRGTWRIDIAWARMNSSSFGIYSGFQLYGPLDNLMVSVSHSSMFVIFHFLQTFQFVSLIPTGSYLRSHPYIRHIWAENILTLHRFLNFLHFLSLMARGHSQYMSLNISWLFRQLGTTVIFLSKKVENRTLLGPS